MKKVIWFGLMFGCVTAITVSVVPLLLDHLGYADDAPDISFSVSPDGHSVLFTGDGRGGQGIFTLDLKTLRVARVMDTPGVEGNAVFMPDGLHIVYSSTTSTVRDAASHLFVASLDGRFRRQITRGDTTLDIRPAVSPDGNQIVFIRAHHYERVRGFGGSPWTEWTIESIQSDGTHERTLSNLAGWGTSPRFAPNGRQIVFAASPPVRSVKPSRQEVNVLYTLDAVRGGAPKPVTSDGYLADPSFSPDARDIVCVSDIRATFQYDIALMNVRTKKVKELNVTRETRLCRSPVFTPDGKHILFLGNVNPAGGAHSGLYVVEKTGANLRRIAGSDLFFDPMSWRPQH